MSRKHHTAHTPLLLIFGGVCALLVVVLLATPVRAVRRDLPPRPPTATPTGTPSARPTRKPGPQEPAGAWIELRVHSPDGAPSFSWQELWTAVQWQDSQGRWRVVEGWRGTLDSVVNGTGVKAWWVAERDLNTGPFRWVIRRGYGGELLAGSEPFYLPQTIDATLQVDLLLAP